MPDRSLVVGRSPFTIIYEAILTGEPNELTVFQPLAGCWKTRFWYRFWKGAASSRAV